MLIKEKIMPSKNELDEYTKLVEQNIPIPEVYQEYTQAILDKDVLFGIVNELGVERASNICKKLKIDPTCLPDIIQRADEVRMKAFGVK
jgi:hypothetical protein